MTPHPPDLSDTVSDYSAAALFYIVKHGVKFTGMPAWPARERDDEVWSVVAFLTKLPELDAAGYERLVWGAGDRSAVQSTGEDASRRVRARCARCHGLDGGGRGAGAFPRLAGQRLRYLTAALEAYATGARPSGIMEPIAAELSAEDREAVARWYSAQPPRPGQGRFESLGLDVARHGIASRRIPPCDACHGPANRHPAYPRLAGQYAAYLEQQLDLFADQLRGGARYAGVMQAANPHALRQDERRAVARYFAAR